MKKTYVTTMPDHVGAFLEASRRISALGLNITRVSYDKAIDLHTLFIEVEGGEDDLRRADGELEQIGYCQGAARHQGIALLEFLLPDVPGSVTAVLELIAQNGMNISFISSHSDGSGFQRFRMGLLLRDGILPPGFMELANAICSTRELDYGRGRNYDNSIFYSSFVSALAGRMDLAPERRDELMINVNLAMQTLEERELSPYKTFDYISRFTDMLSRYRGKAFRPRVTRHELTPSTQAIVIEPPCGSNTTILLNNGRALFIDTGYACYREEMLAILRELLPGFDDMDKQALITHADVDHCGLLDIFPSVLMSRRSRDSLMLEREGRTALREQNALHAPYIRICKLLTGYEPPRRAELKAICGAERNDAPLSPAGGFCFGDMEFEIYEGAGGHLPGEIVLIDYEHGVAFTGDVYVNMKGFTKEQAEYNRCAPVLMTSVDTDPQLAARERGALMRRLGAGEWRIFGGHGQVREYGVADGK